MKISLDTIFGEITEEYPETERVLKKYLGEAYCLTCPGKMFDTIGNGALIHGLSDEEAMNMVHDLQEVVDSYEDGTGGMKTHADEKPTQKDEIDEQEGWSALDFKKSFGKDPVTGQQLPEDDELEPEEGGSPLW